MSINTKLINKIDKIYYPKVTNNWDDKFFREEILKFLNADLMILDIGAGAGIVKQMNFKGLVNKVIGIDPDKRVLDNPFLDKAIVGFAENMNFFESEKFDIVICNNVLEHIRKPKEFLCEVNRVLKKGGLFLAKTPNKFHYVSLIAKVTPNWFHNIFNKYRGRQVEDTFFTYYRLNCYRDIRNISVSCRFEILKLRYHEARSEYLRFNFIVYFLGLIYERFVNLFGLDHFKVLLICVLKKSV
ncbi:MAG: class I SAM-dependent methyltransferase [bacterium]